MDFIFGPINKWLDGKKTVFGLIGTTLSAIAYIVSQVADGIQMADLQTIGAAVSAWLVAVGLGHKAAKIEGFLKK